MEWGWWWYGRKFECAFGSSECDIRNVLQDIYIERDAGCNGAVREFVSDPVTLPACNETGSTRFSLLSVDISRDSCFIARSNSVPSYFPRPDANG